MYYRPEIDGLRALAVIPVILFHSGISAFSKGFLGVDIFFVISGYLITQLILTEIAEGHFQLIRFYERRVRRLFPALFTMVFCCLPFAWFLLEAPDLRDFSQSLVAVATFTSNILFSMESSYFQLDSELKPLLHTWSLAVEEQFYLIFPLALLMLLKIPGKRFFITLLTVFFISLFVAIWQRSGNPGIGFYFLHARIWELLFGAVVCVYTLSLKGVGCEESADKSDNRNPGFHYQVLSLLGLVLIVAAFANVFDSFITRRTFFLHTFIAAAGTAFLLVFAVKGTWVQRLLSNQVLVVIGLMSYSLYLWHQPIFAFVKYWSFSTLSLTSVFLLILLSLLLAFLTWQFIEKPMLRKDFLSAKTVFLSGLVLSLILVLFGFLGHTQNGFPYRETISRYNVLEYQPNNRLLEMQSRQYIISHLYDMNDTKTDRWPKEDASFDPKDKRHRMIILGDSHANDVFNVLINSEKTIAQFQLIKVSIEISEITTKFFDTRQYSDADVLVIASRFSFKDSGNIEGLIRRAAEEGKRVAIVRNIFEFNEYDGKTLSDLVVMDAISNETFIESDFVEDINKQHYLEYETRERKHRPQFWDDRIDELVNIFPSLIVLDRMDYICENTNQQCYAIDSNLNKFFYDYGHHTVEGAKFFGSRIDKINWLAEIWEAFTPVSNSE